MSQSSAIHSKNVLFITTSNLTTNPRLVKEASVAAANGYSVNILCFQYKGWSELLDIQWIAENKNVHVRKISALVVKNEAWLLSGFIEKLFQLLYPLYKKAISLNAYASSKRSFFLKNTIFKGYTQNFNLPFQLIVAHNMGALYPAWLYHRKTNIPFIFDVEDFYPGEQINIDTSNEKHRREFLLKKLLPDAACVTVASPLIGERIKSLVGEGVIRNMVTINNCFPVDEFEFIEEGSNKQDLSVMDFSLANQPSEQVHFVWFSQNIAANRGLELIIPVLAKVSNQVHLHLIGNLYPDFNRDLVEPNRKFISTYLPMPQKTLNRFICQFDVGLAFELTTADENRQICLTNKIWAYLQAGLYILATDTLAQVGFMNEHKGHGTVVAAVETQRYDATKNKKFSSIENTFQSILNTIETIRKEKKERFERAKEFSWEYEKEKLRRICSEITND